jgi:hypothetical protein
MSFRPKRLALEWAGWRGVAKRGIRRLRFIGTSIDRLVQSGYARSLGSLQQGVQYVLMIG